MKTYRLKNGDEMPALGLGTWKSAPGEVGAAVRKAIEIGYRHIDCAAIYQNEAEIGEALEGCFRDGLVEREDLWITSKLWCNRHRRGDVEPAIRETLAALRLDFLDLYLVHWPVAVKSEVLGPDGAEDFLSLKEVPLEETWAGMQDVLELGLTRHIGVSNYSPSKLASHAGMEHPPEVDQVELHPYLQQPELLEAARAQGVILTAYSPLGSKDRPDSMKGEGEPVLLEDPVVREIAEAAGASPAQVLIAWAIQRGTTVIPKSVNPERLAENFAAASFELSASAMERLEAMDRGRRYVTGEFWERPGGPYTAASVWA